MSALAIIGVGVTVLAWPLLYVVSGIWPEHPNYPWQVRHPREEILLTLWCAPPVGLLLIALALLDAG